MKLHTFAFARLAFAGFSLIVAGCGGASATVDGTIGGNPVVATESISSVVNLTNGNFTLGTAGEIVLSSEPKSCDLATTRKITKNSKYLGISIGNLDQSHTKVSPPTGPGTYVVWTLGNELPATSGVAVVRFTQYDAACKEVGNAITGSSGTVTLSAVDNGSYAGTGSITLNTGDHIDIEFDSVRCDGIADLVNNPDAPTTCL